MAQDPRNHYELLGVSPDATQSEIHSAYRRLARRYHPDLNEGGDAGARFNQLSDAYEVLHDPAQRADYDRSRGVRSRSAARSRGVGSRSAERSRGVGSGSAARQVPVFSPQRARRDVPRFLDAEPSGEAVRFAAGRTVRLELVVRWLR